MNIQKTGAFIAERRKQLYITQQQLGEKLCVTDKAVSKWERGKAFPDIELFGRLAVELKCSITELMNGRAESYDGSSNAGISITNDTVLRDNPSESVKAVFEMDGVQILSPYLFGNNLEHTHSCVNSGLSAQMLKNRKFTGKPSCYYGCAEKWFAIGEKLGWDSAILIPDTIRITICRGSLSAILK